MNWTTNNFYLKGTYNLAPHNKYALFDLDHTIIKPSNNKMFSKSAIDWEFYNDSVIAKLQTLSNCYQIIIITNQKGLLTGKMNIDAWKQKIDNVVKQLNIPISIYVSLYDDNYRKPRTGLFDVLGFDINNSNSFYCGDAGGLDKRKVGNINLKKDFSDCDIKFAHNCNIPFIHRDDFIYNDDFLNVKTKYSIKYVDFNSIEYGNYTNIYKSGKQELIILVGCPGSGKSYFCNKYFNEYTIINMDNLQTVGLSKACKVAINLGKTVVIDNTNPSKKCRQRFINIANIYNIPCRCIIFKVSKELAKHNNVYRGLNGGKMVNNVVYYKKFEEVREEEGFYRVDELEFVWEGKMKGYVQYLY